MVERVHVGPTGATRARQAGTAYFTISELRTAFRLVSDSATAEQMSNLWKRLFATCVVDSRVVGLPREYALPRLDGRSQLDCGLAREDAEYAYDGAVESSAAQALVRFSDGTLTLLAGSSSAIRARFERLHVPFAHATIDDPKRWQGLLDFLAERARR